jgi:PAP2 superfamily
MTAPRPGRWTLWPDAPGPLLEREDTPWPEPLPPAERRREVWRAVAREHGLWAAILGVYLLMGLIAPALAGVTIVDRRLLDIASFGYFLHILGISLCWLAALLIWRRLQVRDASGERVAGWPGWVLGFQVFRQNVTPPRVINAVLSAALIVLTFCTNDAWKRAIGVLEPYSWDTRLSTFDRVVHGGRYPWEWLQGVIGIPMWTIWIDRGYVLWYVVLTAGLAWQIWNPNRQQRTKFFIAFAFTWVGLGTVAAHLFASGGPVFYAGLVDGPDPYASLKSYLLAVNDCTALHAVMIQGALWQNHAMAVHARWLSMSAMPSLHVAAATLFAAATWGQSRAVSLGLWVYTLVILVGSVHLGWHYALDGEVAMLATVAIWRLSSQLVRDPRG